MRGTASQVRVPNDNAIPLFFSSPMDLKLSSPRTSPKKELRRKNVPAISAKGWTSKPSRSPEGTKRSKSTPAFA